MKNNSNSHIAVLDSLRAFAAISVCLFHFVCTVKGFVTNHWLLSIFSVGENGVQMFFVISGFVIPWSMYQGGYRLKNFFLFLAKRLARLEPPYVFSVILALLVLWLRSHVLGKANDHINVSVQQVVLHFGYLIPFFTEFEWLNRVYWTLAIEFQYYLFIAILYVPFVSFGMIGRIITYSIIVLLSQFGSSEFLPYWLPLFLLGILLFFYKSDKIQKTEYYTVTCLVLVYCALRLPISSVVFATLPLVCVLYWQNLQVVGLNFAGKFSYSIYLIHTIIGASFINILSHHVAGFWQKLLLLLSGLVITFVCSWLTYLAIERPSKRLSGKIKYRA